MTALDHCEPQLIAVFKHDGWEVYEKPFIFRLPPKRTLKADVSFIRVAEDRPEIIIVVEIKCFADQEEDLTEFYRAIGQYEVYRSSLKITNQRLPLYLAIPDEAYERIKQHPEMMLTLRNNQVRCVIINLEREVIVEWIQH
jgi:hypothetical protein